MQVPILNGIYVDANSNFRVSYPRNLMPVVKQHGISSGYLKPAPGVIQFASAPGIDRGGINWNGKCYRVCGPKLIKVDFDGAVTVLGDVGDLNRASQISIDYSFDRLAVVSDNSLFYWDGSTLERVTDIDLGNVIDMLWIDGYFAMTDGSYIIVTDLADPTSINPLRYGSSETDPDGVKALLKLNNELHALNRYTIDVFRNVGGSGFPFERISGASIQRGTIGTHSCCVFIGGVAFVGGGRNEATSVWLGSNGSSVPISTSEIDLVLGNYSTDELEKILLEAVVDNDSQQLFIHLPDQTLVYDATASQKIGEPVWFILTTGLENPSIYRIRNLVRCYDRWLVGDPLYPSIGVLSNDITSHWGLTNSWEFSTAILYNEGRGAIIHQLELIGLTGHCKLAADTTIWTSYSTDGELWSRATPINSGGQGTRSKRLSWLQQGYVNHWRIQRFNGTSESILAIARLEMHIEGLNV